jgi:hypothetical protein
VQLRGSECISAKICENIIDLVVALDDEAAFLLAIEGMTNGEALAAAVAKCREI